MPLPMNVPKFAFRILLPLIYLVLALLPVVGMISTIAEGQNPFGFLLGVLAFASWPGFLPIAALNRMVTVPKTFFWIEVWLTFFANIGIYFAIGYLIDFAINRRRTQRLASR
jgi:hypothetical protein